MSGVQLRRGPSTVVQIIFGVLLAGTGLYLVPTLALDGSILAAATAAVLGLGGISAAWYLYRREHTEASGRPGGAPPDLYRTLITHGSEAYVILDADSGAVTFASPNTQDVLGIDPERLEGGDGLIDMAHGRDRRRGLRAFGTVRRAPGATTALELQARRPDGGECYLSVRVANLTEAPVVGGVLLTIRDITPRKTFETEIQNLAYYDALTGLANRRFFFEQGEKTLSRARRQKDSLGVVYMDLDNFKQVNDSLGHEKGDELLKAVAASLEESLRETDIIARIGGDEFAVVLADVRDEESAGRVAHRVRETMPGNVLNGNHGVAVGASLGIAIFPDDADNLESLVKAADMAMYQAKNTEAGIQFYRPEVRHLLADQLRLEQDMRQALEHHEFHLHYQPVFNIRTGEMAGAEALSRWRHFTRGMVSAGEFIDIAEKTGLIRSLDRWAVARAVHQRKTQLSGSWKGWVAVNMSPHSLRDPGLVEYLQETVDHAGMEPGSLVLEMPEGAVYDNAQLATDLMWELKNTGVAIALDNYGAGAISFSQLKQLPIDILKLHADFVAGIGGDEGDEHLVEATISIAHGIRAKVLAKGVERDDQVDWLRDTGCDYIQGYLIGAPMPADELGRDRSNRIEDTVTG